MTRNIFVNLPVRDLQKSKTFFQSMGFSFNPQFSDDTAACMVMSDTIYAMLLTHPKAREFTAKEIADAHRTTEVMLALGVDTKDEVQQLVDKAVHAGAREPRLPQDYGFMFLRTFEDPDGHIWEIFWMDPAHVQK